MAKEKEIKRRLTEESESASRERINGKGKRDQKKINRRE